MKRNGFIEEEEKLHFIKGSALDCLLTDPDRWDKDFIRVDASRPTGLLLKFVQNLPPGLTRTSPLDDYREAYELSGYRKGLIWAVQNFWDSPDVVNYYLAKNGEEVEGRTIITNEIFEVVNRAKDILVSSDHTRPYLVRDISNEILFQVPVYFTYRGQACKALLDGIVVDHAKRLIKPFDLKSMGKPISDFLNSYLTYGYFRQAAFYEIAVKSEDSPVKDYLADGYRLDDFRFLVVEVHGKVPRAPVIFRTTPTERLRGVEGGFIDGFHHPGIDSLLDDFVWHSTTNQWEMSRALYESGGEKQVELQWRERT